MTFDDAAAELRGWEGRAVVVELLPDGTVMRGRLRELDAAGIDGALFSLHGSGGGARDATGIAIALFRDGVRDASRHGDTLVVHQGRMTLRVTAAGDPAGPP